MKQDLVDERLAEQMAAMGLVDYIDWETFDLEKQLELQLYLEKLWLPERIVVMALLQGKNPPKKLKSLVGSIHSELIDVLA